jgi:hypothetical protein
MHTPTAESLARKDSNLHGTSHVRPARRLPVHSPFFAAAILLTHTSCPATSRQNKKNSFCGQA